MSFLAEAKVGHEIPAGARLSLRIVRKSRKAYVRYVADPLGNEWKHRTGDEWICRRSNPGFLPGVTVCFGAATDCSLYFRARFKTPAPAVAKELAELESWQESRTYRDGDRVLREGKVWVLKSGEFVEERTL